MRLKLAIVVGFSVLYVPAYLALRPALGNATGVIVTGPVLAVAWLFGARAGALAGLVSFPVNVLLVVAFTELAWRGYVGEVGVLFGHGAEVIVGFVAGRLRDLNVNAKSELLRRTEAEAALRESEERFRGIVENASLGIVLVDLEGRFLQVNQAWCEIVGYSADELLGKTYLEVTHPDDAGIGSELSRRLVDGEIAGYQVEKRYLRKDGSVVWGLLAVALVRDEHGRPKHFISQVQDVTDRKEIEKTRIEQAASIARAAELQRSRTRIVATGESLRRDIAQRLHGSVQNKLILLLHRIDELLAMAASGGLSSELQDLRMRVESLIEEDVRRISLQLYPAILRRGLVPALQSLSDQFESALGVEVTLDEELVAREKLAAGLIPEQVRLSAYRVAEEAFTNVLKHADATTVWLKLSQTNGSLNLSVLDDGKGFEPEGSADGLGIGTMRDYAEVVGGRCDVASAPGEGTAINAIFPVALREEGPVPPR